MRLRDFIDIYASLSETRLSNEYVEQLHVAVSLLDGFTGHETEVEDMSDLLFNQFVDYLQDSGRASDTVRTRRGSILTLWKAAYDINYTDVPPMRVRKLRNSRRVVTAWTDVEVRAIIDQAMLDRKVMKTGVERGLFIASLVSSGWDTALRLGDLLKIRYSMLTPANIFVVQQSKTRDDVVVAIRDSTRNLIDECNEQSAGSDLIWPLWGNRNAFYRAFRNTVKRAGVRCGTFKWIRRGSITAVEKLGGNGTLHAGHRNRNVTCQHYIDWAQLKQSKDRPPSLYY